jgi:ABC-type multidrug transport system fused ATPase/permease subunit
MIKNIFSILIFFFIFLFLFFIISFYLSDENQKKTYSNRSNIYTKIEDSLKNVPLLKNDTKDVIEFNSGYEKKNNEIKRNFWNLFKKND